MARNFDEWSSHNWIYLGSNSISENSDGTKKIRIPEGVFEKGIVDHPDEKPGQDVHWAYETGSGLLIISREKLEGKPLGNKSVAKTPVAADGGTPKSGNEETSEAKYRSQGTTTQQGANNSYSATVPKQFFEDYKGRSDRADQLDGQVPEHARINLDKDRERHFLTRERFLSENTKNPCFVLSRKELMGIIGSYRDLEESVVPVPNFLSE